MSVSQLQSGPPTDARSIAIKYSKGVPKPKVMVGERVLEGIARSESKDELSQMERLDLNHLKYMEMMKKL